MKNLLRSNWALLLAPGLIWGASFLFIAEGLESIGPAGVTFVRLLFGFLALSCFPEARRGIDRKAMIGIAAVGVFWMAFPLSMFPFAEQRVSSAVTGMLNGAVPFSATIVAAIIARRAPASNILLGLAVGLIGTIAIAWPTVHAGGSTSALGVGLIMAAVTSYGVALNIARPLQLRFGALPVIWRAQMIALLLTAPLGLPDVLHAHWRVVPLLSLIALGALGTGVAFVLTTVVAGRLGAAAASSIAFLISPVALVLGVAVRHEHVAWISAVGCFVCVGGAWLMQRPQTKKGPALAEPSLQAAAS